MTKRRHNGKQESLTQFQFSLWVDSSKTSPHSPKEGPCGIIASIDGKHSTDFSPQWPGPFARLTVCWENRNAQICGDVSSGIWADTDARGPMSYHGLWKCSSHQPLPNQFLTVRSSAISWPMLPKIVTKKGHTISTSLFLPYTVRRGSKMMIASRALSYLERQISIMSESDISLWQGWADQANWSHSQYLMCDLRLSFSQMSEIMTSHCLFFPSGQLTGARVRRAIPATGCLDVWSHAHSRGH